MTRPVSEPDELEHRTPEPDLPPTEDRRERRPGSVAQDSGWCAPSETIADLPKMSVPRGGVPFPTDEQARWIARNREWWAGFRLLQHERTKRHKEAMRTVRGAVVILAALVLLLALGDALPWQ